LFILVIILSVGFAVVNGAHDAANAIATVVGTRVLSPMKAVAMAAVMNLIGAATGLAVAHTIGKGIVSANFITNEVIVAALVAAIVWEFITLRVGLPVSGHHSLIAGLVGAGLAQAGTGAIEWSVLTHKVLPSIVIAPALGFVAGYIAMVALLWICRRMSPLKVEGHFSKLQILSAGFMAYAHGKNDGQMPIGLMAVAWMIYQTGSAGGTGFSVPFWIIAVSATAIAFGTALGGWRIIKTLGVRMTCAGLRRGDGGGVGYRDCVGVRHTGKHYSLHNFFHHGCRLYEAALRGEMGHCREHHAWLDSDISAVHPDRMAYYQVDYRDLKRKKI
jgi:PiT family inorganic phosphate transporter